MQDTRPLLLKTDFPAISRHSLKTLQVNLGYKCNQSCTHCHVNAGPQRTEMMDDNVIDLIIEFLENQSVQCLDVTGGAPELHPRFRHLAETVRGMNIEVIDRCNLTILSEPDQEDLADFLADKKITVVASMPCYSEKNVDEQRGKGVFGASIEGLHQLNAKGYGRDPNLQLNLVYNPNGAFLPPSQEELQDEYKERLQQDFGIVFNNLFVITNMPIQRFGAQLLAKGRYEEYMQLLRNNFTQATWTTVMCRDLISLDWQGFVYDCDFNQMLDIPPPPQPPLMASDRRVHLRDIMNLDLQGRAIAVGDHCYGCTAGQGSSCGGALAD